MAGFEYKVVPAPMRGLKARGVKGTSARFANALEAVMNEMGTQGWEYQRTDTLPVEERQGLTGKTTTFQNMLVFQRALVDVVPEAQPIAALIEDQTEVLETAPHTPPAAVQPEPEPQPAAQTEPETVAATAETLVDVVAPEKAQQPAPKTDAAKDATLSAEAQNRVDETLNTSFSFPWNRRPQANPAANRPNDDDKNIPAE